MAVSQKITRWNMHQLSSYEQMQYHRERRAAAREQQQKTASLANGFAAIRNNLVVEQGNLFSRIALERMKAQKLSKLA
jgi:hypothetical protein